MPVKKSERPGSKKKPVLSVIMPVFNERDRIVDALKQARSGSYQPIELIVVDDGSTDGTTQLLKKHRSLIDALVLCPTNLGKGAALQTGIAKVTGDIVIFQDADLEYDPQEYARLLEPILQGRADVVYGSRFIGGEAHRVVYFWHSVANGLITLLSNICTNLNLTDIETGYKVFRREILNQITITERSFGIEPEITAQVAKIKARLYEVGISYHGRTYHEGKKIGLPDAVRAVYVIGREWLRAQRS